MKRTFLILLFLSSFNSCQINWHGDIDLGSDFYYLVEPAFNSVVIPVNPKEPYKSSIYVIRNIESLGFNKNYVLATSKTEQGIKYWRIDKTTETKKLGYRDDSIVELSNVSMIDSIEFEHLISSEKIELRTKTDYRKELDYE